jgi:hypothetical protein
MPYRDDEEQSPIEFNCPGKKWAKLWVLKWK